MKPLPELLGCPGDCGWGPGMSFVCSVCRRERCYCQGAGDNMPEACDDCWAKAQKAQGDCMGAP